MTEDAHSSTHPPLPPTTEDKRFTWLRLLRSRRVGISTFYRLLGEYGSAEAALDVLPEIASAAGVKNYQICPETMIEAELKAGHAAGAQLIFIGQPEYPATLASLTDAPPFLWALGDLSLMQRQMVALVGARNASSLGTRMTKSLAKGLVDQNIVVVSGLARGIDTAAHHAALQGGTIAVQAGGIDVIYPAENTELAFKIAEKGLRLSEQPPGLQPTARHFPIRNRIISGISEAVVVVEAAAKSGSLITARNALDQGREVLAVPGHPFDARASGCNMLIRDGATLVRGLDDVLECLQSKVPAPRAPIAETAKQLSPQVNTAQLHQQLLNCMGPTPMSEDQLIRDVKTRPDVIAPILLELELSGKIQRHPGGLLSLS
ncbi:DNA-processing protein DprA [Pseudaestuariivita rosea]|uniref:DNA-processing protein DprA n=1 Tax=Pseudaestuariivita rosea TaxID=2763263 RepID=UPI001ABBA805|nr:DNA-processing protein DprA [Pseudaestuariivita rosea]